MNEVPPVTTPPEVQEPFLRRIPPLAFTIVALAITFVAYQFVAGGLTLILAKGSITRDNVALIRWATLGGQLLCILLPTILLAKYRYGNIVRALRIKIPTPKESLVTLLGVFALQQMAQGYMMAQGAIPLPARLREIVEAIERLMEETYRMLVEAQTPLEFAFVLLIVALVPALSEEFLFRGLVQRSLGEATGGLRAAVIAGILFAGYHLNPFGIVPLAALGVYFGFIVYRSGNIVLAIAAHFFNNFVACTAVYLQLNDDFIVLAPGGGSDVPLLFTNFLFFTLVFIGATYYFVRMTETKEADSASQ